MTKKLWKKVELTTEFEQNIRITPTPEFDNIELSYKELFDPSYPPNLYLDKKTIESLIVTLQEMINYLEK